MHDLSLIHIYLAIGAHSDKKLGLPGEEALGVESAVKMLRAIGDDELPDLSGQRVCVIGGGNVAMDVARSAVPVSYTHLDVYKRQVQWRLKCMTFWYWSR